MIKRFAETFLVTDADCPLKAVQQVVDKYSQSSELISLELYDDLGAILIYQSIHSNRARVEYYYAVTQLSKYVFKIEVYT